MSRKEEFHLLLVLVLCAPLHSQVCDESKSPDQSEGNQGESGLQPWLGVLRVHIHQGTKLSVALTGAVLVKEKVALVNANDLSNVPVGLLKSDSKLMFIPKTGEPWSCGLRSYVIHPEHEFSAHTTLAILELDHDDDLPVKPICWPGNFFNTNNELYAFGYTDENQLLEKEIHKIIYVESSVCDQFYLRAGFSEPATSPSHYVCGFAASSRSRCLWENGMVLASNSSGRWTMVGLSVRGPGCAAPARFIDFFSYMPWVESVTSEPAEVLYYDSA